MEDYLNFFPFDVPEPPRIRPFIFESEIHAGKDTQVTCYVSDGDTPLSIRWYFHGREVGHNMGVTTMKLGSRSSILNIEAVTHGHSGVYTCVASNSAGTDRAKGTLTVHGIILLIKSFNINLIFISKMIVRPARVLITIIPYCYSIFVFFLFFLNF